MKKTFIFLLCAALVTTGCKQKNKSPDPLSGKKKELEDVVKKSPGINAGSGNYEVATPAGWERTENETGIAGLTATVLLSPIEKNDNFRENINVVSEKVGNMSTKDYVLASETNMAAMMTGFKKGKSGEITIDGETGYWFDYSHAYQNIPVDARLYVVAKNSIAYLITASAYKGKLKSIEPQIEEVVKSFRIR